MSPLDRVLDAAGRLGLGARKVGSGWTLRCPAHDDRSPSLSLAIGADGRALLKCHAGCSIGAVLTALDLKTADLFVAPQAKLAGLQSQPRAPGGQPAASEAAQEIGRVTWRILDDKGHHVATHRRIDLLDPRTGRAAKKVWWEKPDGSPGLPAGVGTSGLPLYGSESLCVAPGTPVVVCEGEKATDALRSRAVLAVGTVTGASGCPGSDALACLAGRDVLLWPDNDKPGRLHMERLALALRAVARSVKFVAWAEAPEAGDAADFHGGDADLAALLAAASTPPPPSAPVQPEPPLPGMTPKSRPPKRAPAPQGGDVLFPPVEPWPEPVDGAILLDEVAQTIRRFVVLPSHAPEACALFVAHTWTWEVAADYSPRLDITAPTMRCGKSQLLETLAGLVARPLVCQSLTAAALFRIVEKHRPTLLVDEADALFKGGAAEEVRQLLNSGATRSGRAIRCVGDEHEVRGFGVYGPVAIAGIGDLPSTVRDRAIRIPLRRKMQGESCEKRRYRDFEALVQPIQRRLARWAVDRGAALYDRRPDTPEVLDSRAADGWEPLLAIADEAGGRWPTAARAAAVALSAIRTETDDSRGEMLLADAQIVFKTRGLDRLSTEQILSSLNGMDERPWSTWIRGRSLDGRGLARLLKPYGIRSSAMRLSDGTTRKGYERSDFADAWARYLPPPAVSYSVTGATNGPAAGIEMRNDAPDVTQPIGSATARDGACNAVTPQAPPEGPVRTCGHGSSWVGWHEDGCLTCRDSIQAEAAADEAAERAAIQNESKSDQA